MTHNKAKKSKILALILGLTMCLALMLGIVFASPTSTVYAAGGTDEILEIKGDTDVTSTDGRYTYTASNKTLILKNYNGKQIRLKDDATINLQGNNSIKIDENSHFYTVILGKRWDATGIKADKGLTITGIGTLAINSDITKKENAENAGSTLTSSGIESNGDLTIKDNVRITIKNKEIGEKYGIAIMAQNNLNIIDSASIDINNDSCALYSQDGNITISGTDEKTIKTNRNITNHDAAFVDLIYTSSGDVDISGTGKVLLEAVNGKKLRAIGSGGSIKLHDNANVEINGFDRGMDLVQNIDIKNSTLKIFSTISNSSAFRVGGNTISITDSAVTVDVHLELVDISGNSPELHILGKSTVYVYCIDPAMCNDKGKTVRKHFELSEGGSITLISNSNDYRNVWAELGEGTNLEVGEKLGQSVTKPTWFEYKASDTYNGYMTRFVYGDTSKASAKMNDVTINGLKDEAISDTDVKITLTGDTFKAIAKDTDATTWFKNMPKGLVAKVKADVAEGATEMTITVSGTPEIIYGNRIWLEVPATAFTATNYGMTVEFNRNARYEIVSSTLVDVPTPIEGLVYNGEYQTGVPRTEAYTVGGGRERSAGTYIATLHLQFGYKWSDGTTEDKTVEWSIAPKPIEIDVVLEKTEYDYTGYEIAPIYRVKTEDIYNLSSSEYSVELKNNKEIGENTASITISNKTGGNYEIKNPVTKYFSIVKSVRNAPEGLRGIAPSVDGATDGKITGTTADMEYSTDTAFTSPIPCENGETTGLAEGIYYVRYKATTTSDPSHYATVKVMDNTVTVTDGAGETNTKYKSGDTVTVKATAPTGKRFVKWSATTGISLSAAQLTQEEITFTMPDNDVTLIAEFEDIVYSITVTDGMASLDNATYQTEVTVAANAPVPGKEFDKWVVGGITLPDEDLAKSTLTFKMPASDVTMEATYKDVVYRITVTNGTATPEMAKYQEEVTVKANPAPSGKVFDKWTCETPGVTIEFANATSSTTTFVMPAQEIEIKAHFRAEGTAPSVEIKVDGGTGAGTYKEGDSVTITANDPAEGKVFKGWQDASGKIVSTDKSYTFKVTGATTLTAVYEDAPAAKKGLSGGAIAGIVIGSVLLAGIGGFAIYWFAISKKTFADLGVALKKGFTAMGNGIKTACRAIGNFFKTLGAKIKALFTKKK